MITLFAFNNKNCMCYNLHQNLLPTQIVLFCRTKVYLSSLLMLYLVFLERRVLGLVSGSRYMVKIFLISKVMWTILSIPIQENSQLKRSVYGHLKPTGKYTPGLWQMFNTPIVRFVPILFNSSHCSPYS